MVFQPQSISEQVMYAVKRIEASGGGKSWVGTGYKFNAVSSGSGTPLIITNRHVVENADQIRVLFHLQENGSLTGETTFLDITDQNGCAVLHPNPEIDLAAIVVGRAMNTWKPPRPGVGIHWCGFDKSALLPDEAFEKLDACGSVTMVGCPSGLWDKKNGLPLFRRGVTATHPAIDFEGRPEFVVDIGVYSGSSGSPVFLMEDGLLRTSKLENSFTPGSRFALMGTLWGGPRITENGEVHVVPVPTRTDVIVTTGVRMHLGYVLKARETLLLVNYVNEKFLGSP